MNGEIVGFGLNRFGWLYIWKGKVIYVVWVMLLRIL